MRHRLLTRLALVLAGAGALAVPADASAQAPPPGGGGMGTNFPGADAFTIRYFLTNADGTKGRQLAANDFVQFVNIARCQCGQKILAEVRLKATMSGYDQGILVDSMVGTSCNTAEQNPVGQFKRCAVFKSSPLSDYQKGITETFHPVWLSNGVETSSTDRNPSTAPAAGSCTINQGEGGVWMCGQTNSIGGCQSDEFFITGTQNINIGMGGIKYDFVAPLAEIQSFDGLPGDSAIVLNWQLKSVGDIAGFRVLCEDADTGRPVTGKTQPAPALNAIPNGTFFYTKDLLCPNGIFSDFNGSEDEDATTGDATTGDATTGDGTTTGASTTTDGVFLEFASSGSTSDASTGGTSFGTTDGGTGTTGVAAMCGNGELEGDEQCDDGNDDDTDSCLSDCTLNVSQGMRNLNWDYVCTGHLAYNTNSVRIEGLENGKNYNFVLVAYDKFGNPKAVNEVVQAAPVETYDLWEQCAADGGVCGESGFCNVGNASGGLMAVSAITMLGLGGIGVARRRRNRA